MTMSSLASEYIDVGNNYGGRYYNVSKVTIHHMAGVSGAADCAVYHRDSGRQCSANYYIGYDGDIVCGVPEEFAPWTSSSWDNDNAAITMECSNDIYGDPWSISDATWDSMIKLCADICNRYGITPYYDGTAGGTFTEHMMFASTGCPGPYIHERMYRIVEEVKAAMAGSNGEWVKDSKGWWYRYADGSYPKSAWEYIGGKWYYFGADGYMETGWVYYGVNWYYLQPKTAKTGDSYGYMVTGWAKIKYGGKDTWFWFADNGAMYHDGFMKIGGTWYAFDANGAMVADDALIAVEKSGAVTIK